MVEDNSGLEQLRKTANKLKGGKMAADTKNKLAEVDVQGLTVGAEVADFYKNNAEVGIGNLFRDSLPTLKVTESNSKGDLPDGSRPSIGSFYYTKDKTEFADIEVSIMSVSRGFYVKPVSKDKVSQFQQIVSGMMLDTMKPFIMYVSGKRLNPLWEFGKALSPMTKDKEQPVPMMAFKVKLSTTKYKHEYGESHYVNFEPIKDSKGQYQLITDIGVLEVIRGGIDAMEEAVGGIITGTEVDKTTGEPLSAQPSKLYQNAEDALIDAEPEEESKSNDDIPFWKGSMRVEMHTIEQVKRNINKRRGMMSKQLSSMEEIKNLKQSNKYQDIALWLLLTGLILLAVCLWGVQKGLWLAII